MYAFDVINVLFREIQKLHADEIYNLMHLDMCKYPLYHQHSQGHRYIQHRSQLPCVPLFYLSVCLLVKTLHVRSVLETFWMARCPSINHSHYTVWQASGPCSHSITKSRSHWAATPHFPDSLTPGDLCCCLSCPEIRTSPKWNCAVFVFLGHWLILLGATFSRFISVVTSGRISFLRHSSIPMTCIPCVPNYAAVDKYLGCFHIMATVNEAAVNVGLQVSLWNPDFSAGGKEPRSGIAESYGSSIFNFFEGPL